MFHIAKHTVRLARLNTATWLGLWRAQVEYLERCCDVSNELTAAWCSALERPNPWRSSDEESGWQTCAENFDPPIAKALACWSRMYDAAVLCDALNDMQPSMTRTVERRVEEFKDSLAAARSEADSIGSPRPERLARAESTG